MHKTGNFGYCSCAQRRCRVFVLFHVFILLQKAVSRIVTEGTMKTAYLKDINNILCPLPTKDKQQNIAKMPSALNTKIDIEQSILNQLNIQKQYLLRQMFI